ncbi:MAG: hypothetical protein JST04_09695 [Bdellovibrionales bacterium]|nr:hypothetical protein [Bdellovibrionales bacterium]
MASLRYSETNCDIEEKIEEKEATAAGGFRAVTVSIGLSAGAWQELARALGEIANREGSELRTDFPKGWTIFWKIRDGDSRFFVAHPEKDQWVATLAVSESHLARIREALASGFEGSLAAFEAVSRMSNVEVLTRLREAAA